VRRATLGPISLPRSNGPEKGPENKSPLWCRSILRWMRRIRAMNCQLERAGTPIDRRELWSRSTGSRTGIPGDPRQKKPRPREKDPHETCESYCFGNCDLRKYGLRKYGLRSHGLRKQWRVVSTPFPRRIITMIGIGPRESLAHPRSLFLRGGGAKRGEEPQFSG
jgi:hypothetical protein